MYKKSMPKKQTREFLSIEQALNYALEQLSENEVLENTKREKIHFIRYANPKEGDRNISQHDAINIDVALMKKNKGHPLLDVHEAIMNKAMEGSNLKADISRTLLNMGDRLGRLMGVTEKAMQENSPGGASISKSEKEEIYKAIAEVEEKISTLKKALD